MRTLTLLLAGALMAAGCGHDDQPGAGAASAGGRAPAVSSAASDAAALGREIYDLTDRAMSYRSSHRGRFPRSLRELGVDELTPATTRSLSVAGAVPTISVGFRSTANRTLSACRGTSAILEEAALSGGEFAVTCTLAAGGSTTLRVSR